MKLMDFNNMTQRKVALYFLLTCFLTTALSEPIYDMNGYLVYCPCMALKRCCRKLASDGGIFSSCRSFLRTAPYYTGLTICTGWIWNNYQRRRFGNQADHFLGVLAFSKALNRTLILPPWVEYRYGEVKSLQVPFDKYFKLEPLLQYHNVVTMERFMQHIAMKVWPHDQRTSFCYTKRSGDEIESCNAKSGNPFGPFWDTFQVDFVKSEFYAPLHYDAHNPQMIIKWNEKYPADQWPVLSFTGAPASFPVQNENRYLQKYVIWNEEIENKTKTFIKQNMNGGGILGIHLRNGQDWTNACQHVKDSPSLFAAPQCVGYKNERGPLTMSMCFPQKPDIIKQVKRAIKKLKDLRYIYVASDSNHMIEELKTGLNRQEIKIVRMTPSNPHLDLAILGQVNYFIGNCVSSYSAFVKRERDVKGLPSEFWSFPHRKKNKHDEL